MGEGSGGKFAHDALELSVQFSLGLYSNWGAIAPIVLTAARRSRTAARGSRNSPIYQKESRVIHLGGGGID